MAGLFKTAYAAAKEIGITPTTLQAAIKREEAKGTMEACPCRGSMVRAEQINRGKASSLRATRPI